MMPPPPAEAADERNLARANVARRALSTGHVVRNFEDDDDEEEMLAEAEAYVEEKAEKRTRAKDLLALAVDEFMLPLRGKDKKQPVDLKTLARCALALRERRRGVWNNTPTCLVSKCVAPLPRHLITECHVSNLQGGKVRGSVGTPREGHRPPQRQAQLEQGSRGATGARRRLAEARGVLLFSPAYAAVARALLCQISAARRRIAEFGRLPSITLQFIAFSFRVSTPQAHPGGPARHPARQAVVPRREPRARPLALP